MTEQIPEAVFWGLAAVLLAATVLLVRERGITARQRGRTAELIEDLRARDAELRHLVTARLPALEEAADRPDPAAGPLGSRLAGTDFAACLDGVLERFASAVEHAQARADRSAKAALKASMRSLQALASEQQVSIAEMQDRHDQPDVLRDLLEIDHTNAQFGRRAQAIAVLCGSWPGRQRATSALVEVVRGATSRIRDYRRVRVNGGVDMAVRSRAVEPVVLAVAELLDNAARHSQPGTTVEVTVQTVHNGACVVVDDAGVGMDGMAVEHAAGLLSGSRTVDVIRLGDPPRFGFAVIGALAERYGFTVSVDTLSPYGGVRAVVFLPSALLTHLGAEQERPPSAEPPAPALAVAQAPPPEHARAAETALRPVPADDAAGRAARAAGGGRSAPATGAASGAVPATGIDSRPVPAPKGSSAAVPASGAARGPAPAARPIPRQTPDAAPGPIPPGAPGRDPEDVTGTTSGGLPKRRRRAARQADAEAAAMPTVEVGGRSAEENARRMGAFARGTRSGRAGRDTPQEDEGNSHE
ncbi:ATP-binding protein [Streptomyces sp. NPDC020801]|uniref:ATP-binding protein n=1 Tax=unclassified Streptomyces TaxID=2593676 RepID=UPI0037A41E72